MSTANKVITTRPKPTTARHPVPLSKLRRGHVFIQIGNPLAGNCIPNLLYASGYYSPGGQNKPKTPGITQRVGMNLSKRPTLLKRLLTSTSTMDTLYHSQPNLSSGNACFKPDATPRHVGLYGSYGGTVGGNINPPFVVL